MNNIEHIKKVAEDLKLKPTEDVLNKLNQEWNEVLTILNAINDIDTNNVEPMVHIDESPTTYMREDVIESEKFPRNIALENANETKDDFIVIKRVIND